MRDFFKPWRRKIGVVTLVLACVLTAGWIRSGTVADVRALSMKGASTQFNLISQDQSLALQRFESQLPLRLEPGKSDRVHFSFLLPEKNVSIWKTWIFSGMYKWTTRCYGFSVGTIALESGEVRGTIWIIPYWSIVLPLTLLSAYMILSNPRPAKPIAPPDPDHA